MGVPLVEHVAAVVDANTLGIAVGQDVTAEILERRVAGIGIFLPGFERTVYLLYQPVCPHGLHIFAGFWEKERLSGFLPDAVDFLLPFSGPFPVVFFRNGYMPVIKGLKLPYIRGVVPRVSDHVLNQESGCPVFHFVAPIVFQHFFQFLPVVACVFQRHVEPVFGLAGCQKQ